MNIYDCKLYGITDSRFTMLPICEQVEAAIIGGAKIIQLREKNLSVREYADKAKAVLKITKKYNVTLIINDCVEAARLSGADGVHLGQSDGSVLQAREILGKNAIIGVTAKTVSQAVCAEREGADYLGSGAVFASPTKPNTIPLSKEKLTDICNCVKIPVFAIGGITADNLKLIKDTGICGVAVVSSLFDSDSALAITQNAAEIIRSFSEDFYG